MKEQKSGTAHLLQDVFALSDNEIQCDEAHVQMVLCADKALTANESRAEYPQLWHHFGLCIDCKEEYELLMDSVEREVEGKMYLVNQIPSRPKLTIQETTNPLADAISQAIALGKQWTHDQMGTLYILFGELVTGQQKLAWGAQRSTAKRYRFIADGADVLGWEVEVSAVEEEVMAYLFEIAIEHPDEPDIQRENIPITLQYGDTSETVYTDEIGVAVFATPVPASMLEKVVVYLAPNFEHTQHTESD